MSINHRNPRQDRRKIGRAPVRKHNAPSVGTEAPGFFNPDMPKSKRKRAALEAAVYNSNRNRTPTNG